MKFHKLFAAGAMLTAMVLAGCSDDHLDGPDNNASEGDFYATLKISLPIGSRSSTVTPDDNTNSSDGYEEGQDYENTVSSVFVVLATQNADNSYKIVSTANSELGTVDSNGNPTYTLTFQSSALEAIAGKGTTADPVYVFAYCNATEAMQTEIKEKGQLSAEGDVTLHEIWGKNSFLMSNRETATTPKAIDSDLSSYDSPEKAFDLGTVDVQRAAVRFDFKQKAATADLAINEYPIVNEITKNNMGTVVLDEMALVNQSNTYYLLARTSASALWTNPQLCVRENTNNWVVSTNEDLKQTENLYTVIKEINSAFSYTGRTETQPAIDFNSTDFDWTTIADIVNNDEDNGEGVTWPADKDFDYENYHIWRYTTENTIPGFDENNTTGAQRRGITTGVIFKGHIKSLVDTEDTNPLAAAMAAGNVLYAFNGVMLGDKDAVQKAAEKSTTNNLNKAYKEAFKASNLDENGDLKKSVAEFTIYRPEGTTGNYTYPVYYTYWNRHWDNGKPTQMGQMEFATVRNNIYKLYVEKINQFGHPGDPDDDPDPEDPDDPDESDKVYFKVSVRVLPWVVRVNNIIL